MFVQLRSHKLLLIKEINILRTDIEKAQKDKNDYERIVKEWLSENAPMDL